mmetsp:Transcript_8258/g.15560  ORF Transcript_8258/g.15560 Transcript_8258/m.15560 type:complete len:534 (-) Transcript_8258:157-1758(-)
MMCLDSTSHYFTSIRNALEGSKELTRKELLEQEKTRNQHLRDLLTGHEQTSVFEVRVYIDAELRNELHIKKEKRARMFIQKDDTNTKTLFGIMEEVKLFFPALRMCHSLSLRADLPTSMAVGSILCPEESCEETGTDPYESYRSMDNDQSVVKIFQDAENFFLSHNQNLKRPLIYLHVRRDDKLSMPSYLKGMSNPKETKTMTMLSFYSFPPEGISDPENFIRFLKKIWEPFDVLGRVYVATEGVNAQMAVPTNILDNFQKCCYAIPEMGKHIENGINIDPVALTVEEFSVAGNIDGKASPPFKTLTLKLRSKIVADGLDKSLNWESAGNDMPPMEWHQKLKEAKEKRQTGTAQDGHTLPLIFDCRNSYETEVGIFDGAQPLGTENFRDSWDAFKEKLKDKPRDTPIMTYCTGGIRCVKVAAYLTQEMGFSNVSRLAGGIIAYDRTINNIAPEEEPMFKGTNYVFDGRVGRKITDDALGICITCSEKTNLLSNCMNVQCHRRMVQCENCRESYCGCCSDACRVTEVQQNFNMN